MTLPRGASYANGDHCPDGRPGELAVYANGERLESPATYVLRDRQNIIITFRAKETGDQV